MEHIDFTIIKSSIDNGRIYFDACHRGFFPSDVIGGRGEEEHARATVTIEAAGEAFDTDVRISSSARISPRKSFRNWLRSVGARDGAQARLHRLADRRYRLEYLG